MRYFLLLFFLSFYGFLPAQQDEACSLHVHGRVTEAATGNPISFAAIYIKEAGVGAYTDSLGNYLIEGLCPGHYTVLVQHMSFGQIEVHQDLKAEAPGLNIALEEQAMNLDEIRISSQRVEDVGANPVVSLEGEALTRSRGESLGAALKQINGVNAIQAGPQIFKPVIHGLHSQRILILNQGVRQEDQQWGRDHAPMVDPFQASRLSVVMGAAAIRYSPDAMAGIVIVDPPAMPHTPGLGGQINLVGISNGRQGIASGRLEGAFKGLPGFSWRIQATGKYAGDIQAPDYMLTNTGAREFNIGGSLSFQQDRWGMEVVFSQFNTELGILRSAHIGNINDFLEAFERGTPQYIEPFRYEIQNPRQRVNHSLLKAKAHYDLKADHTLKLIYSRQFNHRQEFDVRRGNREDVPAMDLELSSHSLDIVMDQALGKKGELSYGFTGTAQKNRNVPGTGVKPFLPWYDSYGGAAFGLWKWASHRTNLEAGLRYDVKSYRALKEILGGSFEEFTYSYHTVSGSVGMSHNLNENWSFRVNLGSAMRPPLVNELLSDGLHHSAARIELGDTSLQAEWGFKAIAALTFRANRRLSFEARPYYHYIQDFIFLQPDPIPRLTIRGIFPVYRYTQTDAGLMGIDLGLDWEIFPRWHYHSQLSLLRSRDLKEEDWLIGMPSDRWSQRLSYERHELGPFRHFRIAISGEWVAKQSRLPEVPSLDYDELPAAYADRIPELEAYLATLYSSPDAYFLVGMEIGASLPLAQNEIHISLEANNLLNSRYREYLNNFWFFADEAGRSLSLRLQYNF